MYDPPAYLWAIIIAGPTAVAALTCIVLYGGAVRSGLGRRRAALLAAAAAAVFGGWLAASAVIAGHGWYRTLPWFPVAAAGYLGLLLALRQIPVVARALAAPGMTSRLELPHTPRVAGVAFLLYLAFGHLPALFALPAGLGDIAAGIAAPLVARRLAQGTGRRAALWFNAFRRAQAGGALAEHRRGHPCRARQPAPAAGLHQEGFGYFAARSAGTPTDALWLGPTGAFESRLDGRTGRRSSSWARPLASISGCRATPGEPRWPASHVRGPRGDRRRRLRIRGRGQGPVPAWLAEGRIRGAVAGAPRSSARRKKPGPPGAGPGG